MKAILLSLMSNLKAIGLILLLGALFLTKVPSAFAYIVTFPSTDVSFTGEYSPQSLCISETSVRPHTGYYPVAVTFLPSPSWPHLLTEFITQVSGFFPDGEYQLSGYATTTTSCVSAPSGALEVYNFIVSNGYVTNYSTSTRILTTSPTNASTTGYTTVIGASGYINSSDFVNGMELRIRLVNNTLQNGIGGSALDAWNSVFGGFSFPIISSGAFNFSTTTTFDVRGQVNMDIDIEVPNSTFLIGSFLPPDVLVSTSTIFYVDSPTALDIAMASTSDVLIDALITGSTTQSVLQCNPQNFDITICLISLIVPPYSVIQSDFTQLKDGFLSRWPIGYITRAFEIFSSTASSSLVVFSATLPSNLIGVVPSISLDLNGALDTVLNSNASDYGYGSSTSTLYETTSYYWDIIVYIALGFYILRRILGSHVVPDLFRNEDGTYGKGDYVNSRTRIRHKKYNSRTDDLFD